MVKQTSYHSRTHGICIRGLVYAKVQFINSTRGVVITSKQEIPSLINFLSMWLVCCVCLRLTLTMGCLGLREKRKGVGGRQRERWKERE